MDVEVAICVQRRNNFVAVAEPLMLIGFIASTAIVIFFYKKMGIFLMSGGAITWRTSDWFAGLCPSGFGPYDS